MRRFAEIRLTMDLPTPAPQNPNGPLASKIAPRNSGTKTSEEQVRFENVWDQCRFLNLRRLKFRFVWCSWHAANGEKSILNNLWQNNEIGQLNAGK